MVSASQDGEIVAWDKPDFAVRFRLKEKGPVYALAYIDTHDTPVLLAGSTRTLAAYNFSTRTRIFELRAHTDRVTAILTFAPQFAFSSSLDGTVVCWSLAAADRRAAYTIRAHDAPVFDLALVGGYLLSVGADGKIVASEPVDGHVRKSFHCKQAVQCVAYVGTNEFIVGFRNGSLKLFNLNEALLDISICKSSITR